MKTLSEINQAMRDYNGAVAYGSECTAWGDFVADCYDQVGVSPWHDSEVTVSDDFAAYWLSVSEIL